MTHGLSENRPMRRWGFPLLVLWASPWTLLGILVGLVGLLTGGKGRAKGGVLEFHGGLVKTLLERLPNHPSAMTLGHTVIARSVETLDRTRAHEAVHVRQYERWGPFFVPAYLGCSLYLWLRRRDPYYDNPFEVEAYNKAP